MLNIIIFVVADQGYRREWSDYKSKIKFRSKKIQCHPYQLLHKYDNVVNAFTFNLC